VSSVSRALESFNFEVFGEDLVCPRGFLSKYGDNLDQIEGLIILDKQRVLAR
jgi:hypothetical protein